MLTCPLCKKVIEPVAAHCPRCQTDLSLLCEVRDRVGEGLARADACLKAGSLDGAVWAYLEVLEVDPDNPLARQQVARVVTAVRHFEQVAPSRRWLRRLERRERRRRRLNEVGKILVYAALLATVGFVAYYVGCQGGAQKAATASLR